LLVFLLQKSPEVTNHLITFAVIMVNIRLTLLLLAAAIIGGGRATTAALVDATGGARTPTQDGRLYAAAAKDAAAGLHAPIRSKSGTDDHTEDDVNHSDVANNSPFVPDIPLYNSATAGMTIPATGLGTGAYGKTLNAYGAYPECWSALLGCGDHTARAVETFLRAGGRRIDCSNSYFNEVRLFSKRLLSTPADSLPSSSPTRRRRLVLSSFFVFSQLSSVPGSRSPNPVRLSRCVSRSKHLFFPRLCKHSSTWRAASPPVVLRVRTCSFCQKSDPPIPSATTTRVGYILSLFSLLVVASCLLTCSSDVSCLFILVGPTGPTCPLGYHDSSR
jgi:hypothetical protein